LFLAKVIEHRSIGMGIATGSSKDRLDEGEQVDLLIYIPSAREM